MLMNKSKRQHKLALWQLIIMIFGVSYGFQNDVIGYYQMSYASIIWYALSAVVYFLPLILIVAEYSSSIRNDHGGFYSWLINSFGERWAFVGTAMWICSFLINMLQLATNQGIDWSELLFGTDLTTKWHLGSIGSTGVIALIAIIVLALATIADCRGVNNIAFASTLGGIMTIIIMIIFIGLSIIVVAMHHGQLAQPVHGLTSFVRSPNPQFHSPMAVTTFVVMAIFSFSGIESVSGLLDKVKNPRKNFPRGILIAGAISAIMYVGVVFMIGFTVNWKRVLGGSGVNVVNDTFLLMDNLGIVFAHTVGLSAGFGQALGAGFVHLMALADVVTSLGVVFVFLYSPIKGLIAGSSNDLWPKKIAMFNKHDIPSHAMWIQFLILAVVLILIAVSGTVGNGFFNIIVDMNNISSVFPYFFLGAGFLMFKKRKDLRRPIVFLHTKFSTYFTVIVMFAVLIFGIVTNLITPLISKQYSTAFWSFIGPIFFFIMANLLYYVGIRHRAKRMIADNMAYAKEHNLG